MSEEEIETSGGGIEIGMRFQGGGGLCLRPFGAPPTLWRESGERHFSEFHNCELPKGQLGPTAGGQTCSAPTRWDGKPPLLALVDALARSGQ